MKHKTFWSKVMKYILVKMVENTYRRIKHHPHRLHHEHQLNRPVVVIFRLLKIVYDPIIRLLFFVILVWQAFHFLDVPNSPNCYDVLIFHLDISILNYLYILQTVQMVHIVMCFSCLFRYFCNLFLNFGKGKTIQFLVVVVVVLALK